MNNKKVFVLSDFFMVKRWRGRSWLMWTEWLVFRAEKCCFHQDRNLQKFVNTNFRDYIVNIFKFPTSFTIVPLHSRILHFMLKRRQKTIRFCLFDCEKRLKSFQCQWSQSVSLQAETKRARQSSHRVIIESSPEKIAAESRFLDL